MMQQMMVMMVEIIGELQQCLGFSNRLIFYNSASGSYTDVVSFLTDGSIRPGTTNQPNLGSDSYRCLTYTLMTLIYLIKVQQIMLMALGVTIQFKRVKQIFI